MGKSSIASITIGIKIQIKYLLSLMNENNYKVFRDRFLSEDSIIEDDNLEYNSIYIRIIYGMDTKTNNQLINDMDNLEYKEYKKYLTKNFQSNGNILNFRDGTSKLEQYDAKDPKNLYHQYLLIPYHKIASTERWGYNRWGKNGASTPVDILAINNISKKIKEEMKKHSIKEYKNVFIVSQYSD